MIDGVVTVIANPIDTSRKQTVVTREIVNNELVQVENYLLYCCSKRIYTFHL